MRLLLLSVGRLKAGPETQLFEDYRRRLNRPGGLGPLELIEVEARKQVPPDRVKEEEGKLLLSQLPEGAKLVALDERGKALASADFAKLLGGWQEEGVRCTAFLIGGADGLDEALRARADRLLAFGPMTWPHRLVRPMLAEQLYRADSILAGHPYHRA